MSLMTPKNIHRHELIGLKVKVSESSCKSHIGLSGKVIDETRNMIVIQSKDKTRRLPKNTSEFEFELPDGHVVEVNGKNLIGRPEDRIKKVLRKW